jgi:hypothetical protein
VQHGQLCVALSALLKGSPGFWSRPRRNSLRSTCAWPGRLWSTQTRGGLRCRCSTCRWVEAFHRACLSACANGKLWYIRWAVLPSNTRIRGLLGVYLVTDHRKLGRCMAVLREEFDP